MVLESKLDEIRGVFPHIDETIYLGAAGSAPFSLVVYDAVLECWNRRRVGSNLEGTGHAWFSEKAVLCREEAARLINADADDICFVSRVVQGLNMVRDIIGHNNPWEKGDNVVLTDQAYPSTGHTMRALRRMGVELRKVENVNGRIMREDMEAAVDEHTKLVCINRTSVGSGFTYDVEQVCEIAHEAGALVVDDAIQTLGAKVIDVKGDGVDFLVSGSYKWQCGPPEAGIMYVRRELCERLEPAFWSYINVERGPGVTGMDRFPFGALDHDPVESYPASFPGNAQRFEPGTTSTDQLWGWHAALRWLNGLGKENIEERVYALGGYLMEGLRGIGCDVKTPDEPEEGALNTLRHGLIMYSTGSYEGDQASARAMRVRPVKPIGGPTVKYQGGYGGIRVSPHIYNTEEEIDSFVEYQKQVMKKL
jgi:cysteine desulfurase/selenocysteine lyase